MTRVPAGFALMRVAGGAAAGGHEDRDLPVVGGHGHHVGADGALGAVAAGEEKNLAAGGVGEAAAVGLEAGPDALVVVRGLRLDVGEDEGLVQSARVTLRSALGHMWPRSYQSWFLSKGPRGYMQIHRTNHAPRYSNNHAPNRHPSSGVLPADSAMAHGGMGLGCFSRSMDCSRESCGANRRCRRTLCDGLWV